MARHTGYRLAQLTPNHSTPPPECVVWELVGPEDGLGGEIMVVQALADLRRKKGLTQDELAELSGVARATIGKIETGRQIARPATRRRLCEALKVSFKRHAEVFGPLPKPGPKALSQ